MQVLGLKNGNFAIWDMVGSPSFSDKEHTQVKPMENGNFAIWD